MSNEDRKSLWESDGDVSGRAAGRAGGSGIRAHMVKQKQVEHEKFVEELDEQLKKYDKNHRGV